MIDCLFVSMARRRRRRRRALWWLMGGCGKVYIVLADQRDLSCFCVSNKLQRKKSYWIYAFHSLAFDCFVLSLQQLHKLLPCGAGNSSSSSSSRSRYAAESEFREEERVGGQVESDKIWGQDAARERERHTRTQINPEFESKKICFPCLPTQIYNAVSDLCIHVSLAFLKLLALHSWDWDVASILIWYSSVTHQAGGLWFSPPPGCFGWLDSWCDFLCNWALCSLCSVVCEGWWF